MLAISAAKVMTWSRFCAIASRNRFAAAVNCGANRRPIESLSRVMLNRNSPTALFISTPTPIWSGGRIRPWLLQVLADLLDALAALLQHRQQLWSNPAGEELDRARRSVGGVRNLRDMVGDLLEDIDRIARSGRTHPSARCRSGRKAPLACSSCCRSSGNTRLSSCTEMVSLVRKPGDLRRRSSITWLRLPMCCSMTPKARLVASWSAPSLPTAPANS